MSQTLLSENYKTYTEFFEAINQYLKNNEDLRARIRFHDFEAFSCSQCGVCCERPWTIVVDKAYFDKYFNVFDSHPSGRFKKPFVKLSGAKTKFYGNIRRKEGSNECVFLEKDKTCFIHRHYGEDFLLPICRQYPRLDGFSARHLEIQALQASCQSVPQLWWQNKHLSCSFHEMKPHRRSIYMTSPHQTVDIYGFHYWLGFALDYLNRPQSMLILFEALMQSLEQVAEFNIAYLSERDLRRVLNNFQAQEFQVVDNCREILDYFVQDTQNDELSKALKTAIPGVSNPEQREELYRHYLCHKMLSYPYGVMKRGCSLRDAYLIVAFQWALIRILAVDDNINEIVNLVESLQASIAEFINTKMTGTPFLALVHILLSIR